MFFSSLPTESLGYTTLMGAPPYVQPNVCQPYLLNYWFTLHLWVRHPKCSLCLLAVYLQNHSVTLRLWVRHPRCSLCFLGLPTESLGYTTVMGAPPKVQPGAHFC